MSEALVKKKVRAILDSYKPLMLYYMPVQTGYGASGVEDFVCCFCGRYIGVETKAEDGKQHPLQVIRQEDVIKSGGIYLLIGPHNILSLHAILAAIKKRYEDYARSQQSNRSSAPGG